MSEEKRTPISIYLTPRSAMILRSYSMGSGYGSVSRTVEEIILAFDAVNESIKNFKQTQKALPSNETEKRATQLVAFTWLLNSIDNAVSRLNKSSE
jgi:hypothetical protein